MHMFHSATTNTCSKRLDNNGTMATDSRDSRLLALPAELRNRIYRLVLVEEDELSTAPLGPLPTVPPLLSTNRQVRQEAMSIYLDENIFGFDIDDFDAHLAIEFWNSTLAESRPCVDVFLHTGEPSMPCWTNVRTWLHAHYQDRAPASGVGKDDNPRLPRAYALGRLFEMLHKYKACESLPAWEEVVEPQLETMRRAFAQLDPSGVWT